MLQGKMGYNFILTTADGLIPILTIQWKLSVQAYFSGQFILFLKQTSQYEQKSNLDDFGWLGKVAQPKSLGY